MERYSLNTKIGQVIAILEDASSFNEVDLSSLRLSMTDIVREYTSNKEGLPPVGTIIEDYSLLFKVTKYIPSKGFFNPTPAEISFKYVGQSSKKATREPYKSKITGTNYSDEIEIGGYKLKVTFSIEKMKKDALYSLTMALVKSRLSTYYGMFKVFPSVGEVLGHQKSSAFIVQQKYFLEPESQAGGFVEPARTQQEYKERLNNYYQEIAIGMVVDVSSINFSNS